MSFHEEDFGDSSLFPGITRKMKSSLGRKGLTGGKFRIEASGFQELLGFAATSNQASGLASTAT